MTATPTCTEALEHTADAAHEPRADFASVYRAHHRAVFLYLCRRLGDAHAAEDVAAEVFVTAMQKWRRAQCGGAPVRAWLYRIASFKAGHWVRANRRRLAREAQAIRAGQAAASATDSERIQAALLVLPARHQHVLSLFYFADLSVEQIAQVERTAVGTVKSRLARAREAMRQELSRRSSSDAA
jgi:RNA polymerase sigma-70 factor (ECF subfamily)